MRRIIKQFSFIALQETKFTSLKNQEKANYFIKSTDPKAQIFWSHHSSPIFTGHDGVGLLLTGASPLTQCQDITQEYFSNEIYRNRYILIEALLGSRTIFIHIVYAPANREIRPAFFEALPTNFAEDAYHLVCGDFSTPISPLDAATPLNPRESLSRLPFTQWMQSLNLVDPWRIQHPNTQEFTGPHLHRRIDFVLMNLELFTNCSPHLSHSYGLKWNHSDHVPVSFSLQTRHWQPRSQSPWRCPTWLLKSPEVQEHLDKSLTKLLNCLGAPSMPHYNPGCLLDEHKRSHCIFLREAFTKMKNAVSQKMHELHYAYHCARVVECQNPTQENRLLASQAQARYKAYCTALVDQRKKSKFDEDIDQAEKCTKLFLRCPSSPSYPAKIPTHNQNDYEERSANFREYWASVFQSPSRNVCQSLPCPWNPAALKKILFFSKKRIMLRQRRALEAPFAAHDFYNAIVNTAKNKEPGPDVLPIEYYQLNPTKWASTMVVVYQSQFSKGRMTKFQRRLHLSLSYKSGNRLDPSNYRPLSLMNADAKLGPKIMSYRLGSVLSSLLHGDQYGFVPGRSIQQALFKFQSLLQLSTTSNLLHWSHDA